MIDIKAPTIILLILKVAPNISVHMHPLRTVYVYVPVRECVSKKFHNDGRLHFSHGHQSPYSVAMLAMAPTICWFSHASMFFFNCRCQSSLSSTHHHHYKVSV